MSGEARTVNSFDAYLAKCASDCVNARGSRPDPAAVLLRACTDLDALSAELQVVATRRVHEAAEAQAVLLQIRDRAARALREYEAAR